MAYANVKSYDVRSKCANVRDFLCNFIYYIYVQKIIGYPDNLGLSGFIKERIKILLLLLLLRGHVDSISIMNVKEIGISCEER